MLFEFQLATKLGYTVDELLERVSSKRLSEYMAYNLIDPFTEDRADKRSAIIARVNATGLLHSVFSVNDFRAVPKEVQPQSLEEMSQILKGSSSQS